MWRGATSNQRWNNVVYFNVEMYNVEQRRINIVYFNVDINNVRQRQTNVFLLPTSNKKKVIIIWIHWIQNFNDYLIILFTLVAVLKGISWRTLAKLQKFFKDHVKYCIART